LKLRMLAAAGVAAASMVTLGTTAALAGTNPTSPPTGQPTPCSTRTISPTVSPNFGIPCPTPTPPVRPNPCPTVTVNPLAGDSGYPSDNPTISPNFGIPPTDCPTPPPVINPLRTERFVVLENSLGLNFVRATGPVAGTGSTLQLSNTLDRFSLPGILRRVNVPHTGIGVPVINLRTCTASLDQNGLWAFAGGPLGSIFRNAIGNGVFNLDGQWTFPFRGSTCSLAFVVGNPLLQHLIAPTYYSLQVTGVGTARA
jgi:hypothetical protein